MKSKIFPSNGRVFFTRCMAIELALKTMLARVTEHKIFLPRLQRLPILPRLPRLPRVPKLPRLPTLLRLPRLRSYGHVECSFENSAEKYSTKSQKFITQFSKTLKNIIFSKKNIFPKRSLWTRKMQFWRSCRKNFATRPKIFGKFRKW